MSSPSRLRLSHPSFYLHILWESSFVSCFCSPSIRSALWGVLYELLMVLTSIFCCSFLCFCCYICFRCSTHKLFCYIIMCWTTSNKWNSVLKKNHYKFYLASVSPFCITKDSHNNRALVVQWWLNYLALCPFFGRSRVRGPPLADVALEGLRAQYGHFTRARPLVQLHVAGQHLWMTLGGLRRLLRGFTGRSLGASRSPLVWVNVKL